MVAFKDREIIKKVLFIKDQLQLEETVIEVLGGVGFLTSEVPWLVKMRFDHFINNGIRPAGGTSEV